MKIGSLSIPHKNKYATYLLFSMWLILLIVNIVLQNSMTNIFIFLSVGICAFGVAFFLIYKHYDHLPAQKYLMFHLQTFILITICALLVFDKDGAGINFLFLYVFLFSNLVYLNKALILYSNLATTIVGSYFFLVHKDTIFPQVTIVTGDVMFVAFSFILSMFAQLFVIKMYDNAIHNIQTEMTNSKQKEEQLKQNQKQNEFIVQNMKEFGHKMKESVGQSNEESCHIEEHFEKVNSGNKLTKDTMLYVVQHMHVMYENLHTLLTHAVTLKQNSHETLAQSQNGRKEIEELTTQHHQLESFFVENNHLLVQLNNESEKIGHIVNVIQDIAEKTNLLALNASIEAARAGEQGKGFSVVANEVKKLADESKQSTNTISNLIENIRTQIYNVNQNAEKNQKALEQTQHSSQNVSNSLNTVFTNTDHVNKLIAETEEMISSLHELTKDMFTRTEEASQHANATMDETHVVSSSLHTLTQKIQRLSTEFDLLENEMTRLD